MTKRTNKLLYALQAFVSKDYTMRNIAGIKFDLNRQTVEVVDGIGAAILHTSKGLVAALANEYAEYLGLDPVGGDFGVVKLAPKNGKKFPPERLSAELNDTPNLWKVFRWDNQDPELNKSAFVHTDEIVRMEKMCRALKVKLRLIPGPSKVAPLYQYGKTNYMGEEIKFCLCQMPLFTNSIQPKVEITYESLGELDQETMKEFMSIK